MTKKRNGSRSTQVMGQALLEAARARNGRPGWQTPRALVDDLQSLEAAIVCTLTASAAALHSAWEQSFSLGYGEQRNHPRGKSGFLKPSARPGFAHAATAGSHYFPISTAYSAFEVAIVPHPVVSAASLSAIGRSLSHRKLRVKPEATILIGVPQATSQTFAA